MNGREFQLQDIFECHSALRGEVQYYWLFSVVIMQEMGEVHYCHLLGGPGKCRQSLTGKNCPSCLPITPWCEESLDILNFIR